MPGVFITSGMDIQVKNLRIDLNSMTLDPITLNVRMDTWQHWLSIARDLAEKADAAYEQVLVASKTDDGEALGAALEEEFRCGMLGISAAAFAIDAFYASVKERYRAHPDEQLWKTNNLARYKQIIETLRWVWKIKPAPTKTMRDWLKMIFRFRDWAVHPPADFREAILRPDIDRGVEWRFVVFRAENARNAFNAVSQIIEALLRDPAKAPEELREWVQSSRSKFEAAAGHEIREVEET